MKTLNQKIEILQKDFYTTKRLNGDLVYHVKDTSPLYSIVRELHDSKLPNDWIFGTCADLMHKFLEYTFEDSDALQDHLHEIVDGSVSIYNYELFDWAKNFTDWVDIARDEGLLDVNSDLIQQMRCGQYCQIMSIAQTLVGEIDTLELEADGVAVG